jgi:hypothetical protein
MRLGSPNNFCWLPFYKGSLMHTKPNPVLTPGHLCTANDVDFLGRRYPEQIPLCTRNILPETKVAVLHQYNIPLADRDKYKIDHLIPLVLGGSNSIDNIWPQPIAEAKEKDKFVMDLYLRLKAGYITQQEAIQEIENWFYR